MSQSRRHSVLEVLSNTATGFIGSWLITYAVLRWMDAPQSIQATTTVTLCTIWSLTRGYCIRRYWNSKLQVKQHEQA